MAPTRPARTFDLLLYGATGFTGRLTALYLARYAPSTLKWGLAGRSAAKLSALRSELAAINPACATIGIVVGEGASIDAVAAAANAVITTAGPYAAYGEPLVRACIASGTHYADLCGETLFTADMISKYGAAARDAGVILIPQAGFDSIPSDLGVLFLAEHARKTLHAGLASVRGVVVASASASGGTVASGLGAARRWDAGRARDPLLLVPDSGRSAVAPLPDVSPPTWVPELRRLSMPNVMASINTRVVRRSAALFATHGEALAAAAARDADLAAALPSPLPASAGGGSPYAFPGAVAGPFGYTEVNSAPARTASGEPSTGAWWSAACAWAGYVLVTSLLRLPGFAALMGALLPGWVLPRPGEGPSDAKRARSYFSLFLVGTTAAASPRDPTPSRTLIARVWGGDPGYGETAKMLGETGILLATRPAASLPAAAFGYGFLTPATALGLPLIAALHKRNLVFEIVDAADAPALAAARGPPPAVE